MKKDAWLSHLQVRSGFLDTPRKPSEQCWSSLINPAPFHLQKSDYQLHPSLPLNTATKDVWLSHDRSYATNRWCQVLLTYVHHLQNNVGYPCRNQTTSTIQTCLLTTATKPKDSWLTDVRSYVSYTVGVWFS